MTADVNNQYHLVSYTVGGKEPVTTLNFPADRGGFYGHIAYSPVTGNWYGQNGGNIVEYTPDLQYISAFQEPQTTKYTYSDNLTGLVVDSQGNVYQTDGVNIIKYDANGNYIATLPVKDSGLGDADCLAIDRSDNLYVGNFYTITKFSSVTGAKLSQFNCSNLSGADTSVAVDSAGNIYSASSINWLIRYSSSGTVTAASSDTGRYVSVDQAGNVYCEPSGGFFVYRAP